MALATEHGFQDRLAIGLVCRGWALVVQGQKEEGIAQIHQGIALGCRGRRGQSRPYQFGLLAEAQACFQYAIDIARQQQARSLELRAATSLAHLWQQQDKHQGAYDLLAPIYNWFTEGFDTADLQEARAILDRCKAL